jgi:hypothetical protein
VNLKVQGICERGGTNKTAFWKLWWEEYPHIHISLYSQLSKYFYFWNNKYSMEATANTTLKIHIKEKFKKHTTL